MALYEIKNGKISPIKRDPFKLEKEIQELTEKNLLTIFGLQLVASEFLIKQFRFDTIAFDKDTRSFTIIEYKKDEKFSVIDQGYAYLSMMLNNKSDFILEYNEKFNENLKRSDVDWSQSKVFFISPSYTIYQIEAVNFKGLPIELYEIKKYTNKTIMYNKIKPSITTENITKITEKNSKIMEVNKEVSVYEEKEMLKTRKPSEAIQKLYFELKDELLKIDDSIDQRITKTMSCYYSGGKGLVWINPNKHILRIHLRKGEYPDTFKKLNPSGWGGYPEIGIKESELNDLNYIDYIKKLIHKAYSID